tara:strand:- start:444 stop:1112 length:669 start_codon:yes stop_codon:yes gene_type:complete
MPIRLPKKIPALSVLNWRSVWDSIVNIVHEINSISRSTLKQRSVDPAMLKNNTVFLVAEGRHNPRLDYIKALGVIPSAAYWTGFHPSKLGDSRINYFQVSIEEEEFKSYIVSYRIPFYVIALHLISSPDYLKASTSGISSRLWLDNQEVHTARCDLFSIGLEEFMGEIEDESGEIPLHTHGNLCGTGLVYALPGKHSISISVFSDGMVMLENAELTIADFIL